MERLCDEVLQLIFYELADPSAFTQVSQRLHRLSRDPYVRAHYFLIHYGSIEAMYHALGRGKLVTERVLDILLTSGAHLSRYLIQIAIHHYFHTQAHFIKTPWVRTVPLRVFAHFLTVAEDKYGEIPRGKGEDDGSLFTTFLKESRLPPVMKSVTWESIKTLLDTYNFIPFSNKDPIMSQFPLALAIEPRLLPSAINNGFCMDYKYRDFVFRKMFERPTSASETRAEDIARNIRELCQLDPAMFVSRTVAAEVCMEAKANELGYTALKQLDKSGDLRFELSYLVEDLLATFLATRSISNVSTGDILLHLFADFPSDNIAVRLVVLVVSFISADNLHMTQAAIRAKIGALGLGRITRRDIVNVLVNPFVERHEIVLNFACEEAYATVDSPKGLSLKEIDGIVDEVAAKCLEIACKGKLLKSLVEGYPRLTETIRELTLSKYQISLEDLPSWEHEADASTYTALLCRDFMRHGVGDVYTTESLLPENFKQADAVDVLLSQSPSHANIVSPHRKQRIDHSSQDAALSELGDISQETLTTMIRHDEVTPVRSRRRILYSYGPSDISGKCRYPHDPLHIGKWIRSVFGPRSSVTAVFMTHAVINDNCTMLHHYLMHSNPGMSNSSSSHVPVTLKHFKLLARLGRTPNFYIWQDIEVGAEFYVDEHDYIADVNNVKIEPGPSAISSSPIRTPPRSMNRGRKRPRRTAKDMVRSYAVPGSDDEVEVHGQVEDESYEETSLQLWIKNLTILLKVETRKYASMKRQLEKTSSPDIKIRAQKNDFIKSLVTNLRTLRKVEAEKRQFDRNAIADYSDNEDDQEYTSRQTKKRKSRIS